jgi:hypothetical protein
MIYAKFVLYALAHQKLAWFRNSNKKGNMLKSKPLGLGVPNLKVWTPTECYFEVNYAKN